jgi:membrane protease YdiL (CAAX protease family)
MPARIGLHGFGRVSSDTPSRARRASVGLQPRDRGDREQRIAGLTAPHPRWKRAVDRYPLGAYFALTFGLSWSFWIPDALAGGHWSHFPGLAGPLVAALVLTAVTDGRRGLRRMGSAMHRWRVPGRCYVAAAVPLIAATAVVGVQALAGDGPSWRELGSMPGLPEIGWLGVLALVLVVNGYGEETGWRGFAWSRLRANHTMAGAALLLALPWALWHVPTFWIDSGMRGFSPVLIPGFLVGLGAGAVVLGWLYERTGASLPVVVVFHTLLNMGSATDGTETAAPFVTLVVIFWAIAILRRERVADAT